MELILPDGVTEIGEYALLGCTSLSRLVLPERLETVGKYALYGCNSLTELCFNGSSDDWRAVTFGNYWNRFVPAAQVRCNNEWIALL